MPPTRRSTGLLAGSLFLLEVAVYQAERVGSVRAGLEARNAVGVAHWEAGRLDEALAVFQPVVAQCERNLGRLDVNTLVAAGNLAMTYVYLERWEQGLPLLEGNIADREQVLGEDHPLTLMARHAQAISYHRADLLAEALNTFTLVGARRALVCGPAHPETVASKVGLALTRVDIGDLGPAAIALTSALADVEQSEGRGSATSVTIRAHLADCHARLGQSELAAEELAAAAADSTDTLGPHHPLTVALLQEHAELAQSVTPLSAQSQARSAPARGKKSTARR
jgi:tetratricopeptide (TPR) repeat protein